MVGSFLNVVIHRVPLGESIVAPRSRCPACETQIGSLGQPADRLVADAQRSLSPLCGADLRALSDRGGADRAHVPRHRAHAGCRRRSRARAALRRDADRGRGDRPRPPHRAEQDPSAGRRLGGRGERGPAPGGAARAPDRRGGRLHPAAGGSAPASGGDGYGRRQARGHDGALPRCRPWRPRCWWPSAWGPGWAWR